MKKITLLIAFTFIFYLNVKAQVSSYSFAQSSGTYVEVNDGTVLGVATGNAVGTPSLDNEVYAVTLPFSFSFNGVSYSSCNVSSNGYITFGATAPAPANYTPISNTANYEGAISAWGRDLNALFELGGLTGDIQWKEVGVAPNREFVVQYRNFRPAYTTSTTLAPYINFQIRLAETTNLVKIVYGSSGIAVGTTNSSTTVQIGLRGSFNTDFNNRTNTTSVLFTASTAGTINTNTQAYSSVNVTPGKPTEGLTYTWTPATCFAPSAITVSNITTTSATLTWQAPSVVPGSGYEYYFSTINTAPTSAGTATTNLSENLLGLNDSSTYYVWVRSNCGNNDFSLWNGPVVFSTPCVLVTSFSQNFDSVTGSALPVCWSKVGTTGSANLQTSNANSAPNTLYIYSSSTTNLAVVRTQPVSNLGAGTHRLRMNMRANFTVGGVIEIGYLTNPSDATSFVSLGSVTATALTYEQKTFTPVSGTYTENLAIRHTGAPANSVLIDDVAWEIIPTCVEPTALNSSAITANSATVSWTASVTPPANGYEYYISNVNTPPTASTTPSGTVAAGSTSVNITNLNSSTQYFVWIRSNCGTDDLSVWSVSTTFTTLCSSFVPTFSQDFTTFPPACWTRSGAGDSSTGPTGTGTGIWAADGFLNVGTTGAVKVNLYSLNRIGWLISPVLDMSAGGYKVKFDYGVTTWNETTPSAMGSDDLVQLLVSQDNGVTWTVLTTFNAASNVSNTLNTFEMNLPSINSVNTKFALYATDGTVDDTEDYDFFIDNFVVESSLNTISFDASQFVLYPNPVKDILNLTYSKEISSVSVYNMLGQEVLYKSLNVTAGQLDVSNLSAGSYVLKVNSEGLTKSVKILKQ